MWLVLGVAAAVLVAVAVVSRSGGDDGAATATSRDGVGLIVPDGSVSGEFDATVTAVSPSELPSPPDFTGESVGAWDFEIDGEMTGPVVARLPSPDVESFVLLHYIDGEWRTEGFERDGNDLVVGLDELSPVQIREVDFDSMLAAHREVAAATGAPLREVTSGAQVKMAVGDAWPTADLVLPVDERGLLGGTGYVGDNIPVAIDPPAEAGPACSDGEEARYADSGHLVTACGGPGWVEAENVRWIRLEVAPLEPDAAGLPAGGFALGSYRRGTVLDGGEVAEWDVDGDVRFVAEWTVSAASIQTVDWLISLFTLGNAEGVEAAATDVVAAAKEVRKLAGQIGVTTALSDGDYERAVTGLLTVLTTPANVKAILEQVGYGVATEQIASVLNAFTLAGLAFDFYDLMAVAHAGSGVVRGEFSFGAGVLDGGEPLPDPDPPATDPAATDPPATDPAATDPPATDPPETDPPETDPPADNGDSSGFATAEEAIRAAVVEHGAGYLGDCGLGPSGDGYCSVLFETLPDAVVYGIGAPYSEIVAWYLVAETSGGWEVVDTAPADGEHPWGDGAPSNGPSTESSESNGSSTESAGSADDAGAGGSTGPGPGSR